MSVRLAALLVALSVGWGTLQFHALAQEAAPTAGPGSNLTNLLAANYLEQQVAALSNRTDVAPEVLQEAQRCIELREALIRAATERSRLQQDIQSASNRLAELRTRLAEPVSTPSLDVPEGATSSLLEQSVAEVQAELTLAQAESDRLNDEPRRRTERRVAIASLLAEHRRQNDELDRQAAVLASSELSRDFVDVLIAATTLRKELAAQESRNLNLELAAYEATSDLLTAQQASARRTLGSLQKRTQLLQEALNRMRAEEAAAAAAAADQAHQRAETLTLPAVIALADTNRELAQARVSVAEALEEAGRQLEQVQSEWKTLRASHDSVRELVQVARESGVSQEYAIGLALRQQEYLLPPETRFDREARERAEELTAARIRMMRVRQLQEANLDLDTQLASIRAALPAGLSDNERQVALAESTRLLHEQQRLLADLSADYRTLVSSLSELSQAEKQWAEEIAQFKALIAEQVLWFRSTEPLRWGGLRKEFTAIYDVVGSELREGLLPWFKADLARNRFVYAGAALLFLAMVVARLPLIRGLTANSAPQSPENRLSLRPALLSLLFTVLLTLPIPVLLAFAAWRLIGDTGPSPLAEHWARAFWISASGIMVVEFVRQCCRSPGLAVSHLRWPTHNARLVRWHFTWLILAGVPIGALNDLLDRVFVEGVTNRPLFLLGQFLLLLLAHLILRPKGGLCFNTLSDDSPVQRPLRLQSLYHALAILIPLSLIAASALGYTYTARKIWSLVGESIQWGLVVLLITLFTLHWLTVLRRRMAVQKAEARRNAGESADTGTPPGPDVWQVYSQSRRLFTTILWIVMAAGLWLIWSDLTPALKKLDQIPVPFIGGSQLSMASPVATTQTPLSGIPLPASEQVAPPASEPPAPLQAADFLSVGDLILAVLVVLLTLAASRNLPGFVDMVLLNHIRFRQGEGYAIVTVLRYAVLLVGMTWALTLLGITWNKVQWLAAAITVGIGFGLQEIFANFVSGLILLFERPVRVGDVITVGEVTGIVSRIQMRATTVRNWDQQELVLPNKDLVTGKVINWTLTDDLTRLAITIGLSYQANVDRASELLLEIARAHPNLKKDPEPFVTFDEFADSTLNVVLRAYVSITVRLRTVSDLNHSILKRFREEGIEIAYPQRDLHIRSVSPKVIALRPSEAKTTPTDT